MLYSKISFLQGNKLIGSFLLYLFSAQRIAFMKDKYIDKKYFKLSEYYGLDDDLGLVRFISLFKTICQVNNYIIYIIYIIC